MQMPQPPGSCMSLPLSASHSSVMLARKNITRQGAPWLGDSADGTRGLDTPDLGHQALNESWRSCGCAHTGANADTVLVQVDTRGADDTLGPATSIAALTVKILILLMQRALMSVGVGPCPLFCTFRVLNTWHYAQERSSNMPRDEQVWTVGCPPRRLWTPIEGICRVALPCSSVRPSLPTLSEDPKR